jgi:hypothetical protein
MTHLKRFFCVLEVTKPYFEDPRYILAIKPYPACVGVKEIEGRAPKDGIFADEETRKRLAAFHGVGRNWGLAVRRSAVRWDSADGELILGMLQAKNR